MHCVQIHDSVRLRPHPFVAQAVRQDESRRPRRRPGSQNTPWNKREIFPFAQNSSSFTPPPPRFKWSWMSACSDLCRPNNVPLIFTGTRHIRTRDRSPVWTKERQVGLNSPNARTQTHTRARMKTIASRVFGTRANWPSLVWDQSETMNFRALDKKAPTLKSY